MIVSILKTIQYSFFYITALIGLFFIGFLCFYLEGLGFYYYQFFLGVVGSVGLWQFLILPRLLKRKFNPQALAFTASIGIGITLVAYQDLKLIPVKKINLSDYPEIKINYDTLSLKIRDLLKKEHKSIIILGKSPSLIRTNTLIDLPYNAIGMEKRMHILINGIDYIESGTQHQVLILENCERLYVITTTDSIVSCSYKILQKTTN